MSQSSHWLPLLSPTAAPLQTPAVRRIAASPGLPTQVELARAKIIAAAAPAVSSAHLALLGDKRLLFSQSGQSFIMYGLTRRSCIALGDPVGPEVEYPDLARRFLALSDRQHRRPAFYQVDARHLHLYAALGLRPVMLGEEARVTLQHCGMRLVGKRRASLRQAKSRAEREGCTFELVEPDQLGALLPQLTAISSAWLHTKSTREKRFSFGRFDPAYVRHFPVALVRCHGLPVAFASVWPAGQAELMVDLMRRDPDAPYGSMDFLFLSLMEWGGARGFTHLNLGMAPLSGYTEHNLPAFWRGVAARVVRHGGRFYNFAGLRRFKAKFAPEWRPKFLVARGGIGWPVIVLDVTLLVAGGLRGLFGK